MLVSSIDAEAYRLFRFTGSDRQLKGERRSPHHSCFLLLEQKTRLGRRTRHQRLSALIQNKYLKFCLLGLTAGGDPSPMLEGGSCRQPLSCLSEL